MSCPRLVVQSGDNSRIELDNSTTVSVGPVSTFAQLLGARGVLKPPSEHAPVRIFPPSSMAADQQQRGEFMSCARCSNSD